MADFSCCSSITESLRRIKFKPNCRDRLNFCSQIILILLHFRWIVALLKFSLLNVLIRFRFWFVRDSPDVMKTVGPRRIVQSSVSLETKTSTKAEPSFPICRKSIEIGFSSWKMHVERPSSAFAEIHFFVRSFSRRFFARWTWNEIEKKFEEKKIFDELHLRLNRKLSISNSSTRLTLTSNRRTNDFYRWNNIKISPKPNWSRPEIFLCLIFLQNRNQNEKLELE